MIIREGNALTLVLGGLRQRAAARIKAAMEASILALARAIEFAVICGAWLLLPVWPVVVAAVAGDGHYLRRYPATLARIKGHLRATWRGRAVSRMVARWLTPPALRFPERIVGGCTHCGNCCLDRACVFLAFDEQGRSRCRIYGSRVWKWSTCGQYPVDGREIALYRCPGFTVVRGTQANSGRVVPLTRSGTGH